MPTLIEEITITNPVIELNLGKKKCLPIEILRNMIKRKMYEFGYNNADLHDRIFIVKAETGSGKSTIIPVDLFRLIRDVKIPVTGKYTGKSLYCIQPRVLTTQSIAYDICSTKSVWNPDMVINKTLGYLSMPRKTELREGLIYATNGMFLTMINNMTDEEIIEKYKFILIDEAHERSLITENLIYFLKMFYLRNRGNKQLPFLLLMSATFDVNIYLKYFGLSEANLFTIGGRTYNIDTHWLKDTYPNYLTASYETIMKLNENDDEKDKNDILVFIQSFSDCEYLSEKLRQSNPTKKFLIVELNSVTVASGDGFYALNKQLPDEYTRRVIIATSVAETGLTINTLKYIIDCGWSKVRELYPPYNIGGLISKPSTQSRVIQRKGRVGRLFEGHFYPMFSEKSYKALIKQQYSDITNVGFEKMFLLLVREQQKNKVSMNIRAEYLSDDIDLLEPISKPMLTMYNSIATMLGYISPFCRLPESWNFDKFENNLVDHTTFGAGYGLTTLGYIASKLSSVNMEKSKVILSAYSRDVYVADLITAICVRPNELFTSDSKFHNISRIHGDDFIETIYIYNKFENKVASGDLNEIIKWCNKFNLDLFKLISLSQMRDDIIEEMIMAGLNPFNGYAFRFKSYDNFAVVKQLKMCFYDGYRMNLITDKQTLHGLSVTTGSKSKYIITDEFDLKSVNSSAQYSIGIKNICELDGYFTPNLYEFISAKKDYKNEQYDVKNKDLLMSYFMV